MRKDVECTFGIIKVRFRFFKNPIELHCDIDIDNAFFVCCILHNMLLEYDHLDTLWTDEEFWGNQDPDGEFDAEYDYFAIQEVRAQARSAFARCEAIRNDDTEIEVENEFFALRQQLIVHYKKARDRGEVEWLI